MALETCVAFLLADEFDAEEYMSVYSKASFNAKHIRGDDDDEDNDDEDDTKNYFSAAVPSLSVLDFQKHFQLTQTQVEELVRLLSACRWTSSDLEGWTVMHAVLASLWSFSTLEPLSSVAARFHTNEELIRHQMSEFCTFIVENFSNRICWPKWKEAEASAAGFSSAFGLPGTVCVVGSCLVQMERPNDVPDPEEYRDFKKKYSVNLLAFCDHRGRFTYVSSQHPGGWHNSRVLLESDFGHALQEDPVNLLHGRHLIGDHTFPLSEHLLTPFPDYGTLGEKKLRYNLKVKSALKIVQGSLKSLRNKFIRLRSLQMDSVSQTSMAIKTCCILFNMYLDTSNTDSINSTDDHTNLQQPFHELPHGHSGSLGGISKRQDIAASLGRKPKKDTTKGYYRQWYEDLNI